MTLTDHGKPQSCIIVGDRASSFHGWIADELQRYFRQLSGAEVPIVATSQASSVPGTWLLIGGPNSNEFTASAVQRGLVSFADLRPDGFVLKSVTVEGRPALIVAGNDERSTMYAAYELLERLGVVFTFTGDIIPEPKPTLQLPNLDVREEPHIPRRGFHIRHFVMPWMGLDDLRRLIDQMAKLKCNYLEFFWYVGGPWIEFSYRGEKQLIGDIYSPESGYTAWRIETSRFTTRDVVIGKEHFTAERCCAPEFQHCQSGEEACRVGRDLLRQIIDHAHARGIEVWLGMGDCPAVPHSLGRYAKDGDWHPIFGRVIPPGDPVGAEIWTAVLNSMVETYPNADGYWVWLAELYFQLTDEASHAVVKQYDAIRPLIPRLDALRAMGYDQYFAGMSEEHQIGCDLGLLHYAKVLAENARRAHPNARLGISVLGRSYLFPALDAVLPKDVALQSMEAAICWNRSSRVPMENFAGLSGRDTFLVPRLDDDENEFAMQFNVGLYDHDRVLSGSHEHGVCGIAPQVGKTRGLEQNARYIADGSWRTSLRPAEFYRRYVAHTFGEKAADLVTKAYRLLEENETFLGFAVDTREAGPCFQGMGNFLNYADSRDINWLKPFRDQTRPFNGPDFPHWNVQEEGEPLMLKQMRYRLERFGGAIARLEEILGCLRPAREVVLPGSRRELEYVICKTEAFALHLRALCSLMEGLLAYDGAFRAKRAGDEPEMLRRFDACETHFAQARALAEQTAENAGAFLDHPSEKHILFRYNVRIVLPLREFGKLIGNVANFHRGRPYWERIDWDVIAPPNAFGSWR